MSRYKGRTDPKEIEKTFPHIVEMIVPLGGFGKKLDNMYEWHWARDIEAMRGCGWRDALPGGGNCRLALIVCGKSAFAVAIGCKADMACCSANVGF